MTDEREEIRQAAAGDEEAFCSLVRRHQAYVRAYIATRVRNDVVVDDVAQEVFVRAFRTLSSYREEAPFIAWLIGIARHRMLDHFRAESRNRATMEDFTSALAMRHEEDLRAEQEPETTEAKLQALQECVDGLPEESASLIRRHYLGRNKTEDIAVSVGRKASGVRVTLMRIRQLLRACIEQRMAAEEG